MQITRLPSARLPEIQQRYKDRCVAVDTGWQTFTPSDATGGPHALSFGYIGFERYQISAEHNGRRYFHHRTQRDGQYEMPVISHDGKTAYTQVKHWESRGSYTSWLSELRLDAHPMRQYPQKLFTLEHDLHDDITFVGVSADDRSLLFHHNGEIVACPRDLPPTGKAKRTTAGAPAFQTVARFGPAVEHVDVLADGSLLAFPRNTWRQSCFVIEAQGATITEVPLRVLSRQRYIDDLSRSWRFRGISSDEVERFLDALPDQIVNTRDHLEDWESTTFLRPRGTNPVTAFIASDGPQATAVFTWDGTTLRPTTTLPVPFDRVERNLEWSPEGRQAVMVQQSSDDAPQNVHIIDFDGSCLQLPQVDHAELREDVLEVTWDGRTRVLPLPIDVPALMQDESVARLLERALLGSGDAPHTSPTTGSEANATAPDAIAREGDFVIIGGVSVPVRKTESGA